MWLNNCDECSSEQDAIIPIADNKERVKHFIDELKDTHSKYNSEFPLELSDIEFSRCCAKCGKVYELIEVYKDEFRPQNQERIVDGFAVDPKQRYFFDNLDNSLRPMLEHQDWFGRPYITTARLEDTLSDDSYSDYLARVKKLDVAKPESEAEWLERHKQHVEGFNRRFPGGVAYTVRVYDGGAWDRSTWKGEYASLEAAVEACNSMCE